MKNVFDILDQVQQKVAISELKEIYRAGNENPRNIIYTCTFNTKPAILKIYNDPRWSLEPSALKEFHQNNRSTIMKAPALFAGEQINSKQGWLLTEKLPESKRFEQELPPDEREKFLKIYLEYRKNYPETPTRELSFAENFSASEFHNFRINRWLEMANNKDYDHYLKTGQHLWPPKQIAQITTQTLEIIRQEFANRKMIWCHGHFKGHDVFETQNGEYYLIDFAHSKMYPEGYELAFIVWADFLNSPNSWKLDYESWQREVSHWLELCIKTAEELQISNPEKLMLAALMERSIGTILADVLASERPIDEKQKRVELLIRLLENCIKMYQQ